jgi:hypothetical protein
MSYLLSSIVVHCAHCNRKSEEKKLTMRTKRYWTTKSAASGDGGKACIGNASINDAKGSDVHQMLLG